MQESENFTFLLFFITQSYFFVPKKVRLNWALALIMKINNKRDLQNVASNHFSDSDYKEDFVKIYKECTKEPFSFLTILTTLLVSDASRSFTPL